MLPASYTRGPAGGGRFRQAAQDSSGPWNHLNSHDLNGVCQRIHQPCTRGGSIGRLPLQYEPVGRSFYVEPDELTRIQRIQYYRSSSSRCSDNDHMRQPVLDPQFMADDRPVRLANVGEVEVLERIFPDGLDGLLASRIQAHGRRGRSVGCLLYTSDAADEVVPV